MREALVRTRTRRAVMVRRKPADAGQVRPLGHWTHAAQGWDDGFARAIDLRVAPGQTLERNGMSCPPVARAMAMADHVSVISVTLQASSNLIVTGMLALFAASSMQYRRSFSKLLA